jgi:hypothetical protein
MQCDYQSVPQDPAVVEPPPHTEIFCVKCRKKVQPTHITAGPVTFTRKKTGTQGTRYSLQAVCPVCSINMKRFIKEEEVIKYPKCPDCETVMEPALADPANVAASDFVL